MSDMDITAKINNLKSAIERGKADRAKAEANKETYEAQLQKTEAEIRELGVEPSEVDSVIEGLDAQIKDALAHAEELIPAQYKGVAGQ